MTREELQALMGGWPPVGRSETLKRKVARAKEVFALCRGQLPTSLRVALEEDPVLFRALREDGVPLLEPMFGAGGTVIPGQELAAVEAYYKGFLTAAEGVWYDAEILRNPALVRVAERDCLKDVGAVEYAQDHLRNVPDVLPALRPVLVEVLTVVAGMLRDLNRGDLVADVEAKIAELMATK